MAVNPLDLDSLIFKPSAPALADEDPLDAAIFRKPSGFLRRAVADTALSVSQGVVGLGEAAVGALDIPTLGRAGKALKDYTGYDPHATTEFLEELKTPEQQQANRAVAEAKGFGGTLAALAENPSVIPQKIAETVPLIAGGGAVARALPAKLSALARGAVGEGALAAGSAAEQTRQQTTGGVLTPEQAALNLTSGAVTGAITRASGGLANKLGIGDIEQLAAGGTAAPTTKGLARRTAEGALTEGVLEEAPQSAQEQALQNIALGRPAGEGVPEATATGAVLGSVIGAGASALPQGALPPAVVPPGVVPPVAPPPGPVAPDWGTTTGVFPQGQPVEPGAPPPIAPEFETALGAAGGLSASNGQSIPAAPGAPSWGTALGAGVTTTSAEDISGAYRDQEIATLLRESEAQKARSRDFAPALAQQREQQGEMAMARGRAEGVGEPQPETAMQRAFREAQERENERKATGKAAWQAPRATAEEAASTLQAEATEGRPPTDADVARALRAEQDKQDALSGRGAERGGRLGAGEKQGAEPADAGRGAEPLGGEEGGGLAEGGAGVRAADQAGEAAAGASQAEVDARAHEAATSPQNEKREPSDAQIDAGNWPKGHVRVHGLDVSVENPKGSKRRSKPGQPAWEVEMQDHYGYIRGTQGRDKEHIDAFIGPAPESEQVFVVDQYDPKSGRFDEHKIMLGYTSQAAAEAAYDAGFSDGSGPNRRHAVSPVTVDAFKAWLKEGDTKSEFTPTQGKGAGEITQPAASQEAELPAKERRTQTAERQRISEMSPEEMRRELLVDAITGLGNKRAYTESRKLPVQVSIDLDSLKWVNDNLGHDSGDVMLRAFGEALAAETTHGYHLSGDEFVMQGASEAVARAVLARVGERMAGARVEVTLPDGTVISKTGIGFSYGLGGSYEDADVALRGHKAERERGGQRPGRGQEPSGVERRRPGELAETPAEGEPREPGGVAAEERRGAIGGKAAPQKVKEGGITQAEEYPSAKPLVKHFDERLSDAGTQTTLSAMAANSGWSQRGGELLRDADNKVTGRTAWIPKEPWFAELPERLNEAATVEAVKKAIAGEKLGAKERRVVGFMLDAMDRERGEAPEVDIEGMAERAAIADTALDALSDDDTATLLSYDTLNDDQLEEFFGSEPAAGDKRAEETPTSGEAGGRGAPGEEARPAEEPLLEAYTETDLKQREEARVATERREAEETAARLTKAEADKALGEFVLSGSDREADELAARGQESLFDQPTEKAAPTESEVDATLAADMAAAKAEEDRPGRIDHMVVEKAKRELAAGRINQGQYDNVIKNHGEAATQYASAKPTPKEEAKPEAKPATEKFKIGMRVTVEPKTWFDGAPVKDWPTQGSGVIREFEKIANIDYARVKYDSGRTELELLDRLEAVPETKVAEPETTAAEPETKPAERTAAEWATEMARLRDIKPRPIAKFYGANGPTEAQRLAHVAAVKKWDSDFRKASKAQKEALERDNAAFRAKAAATERPIAKAPPAQSEFIKSPDGSLNFGQITEEIAQAIGRQAAPIRLRAGDKKSGAVHIKLRHEKGYQARGYQDAESLVSDIARNFNAIYARGQTGLSLAIIKAGGVAAYTDLELSPEGAYYDVKTATPIRDDQFKNKVPLWIRAGTSAPSDLSQTPFIPGTRATQNTIEQAKAEEKAETKEKPAKPIIDVGEKIEGARKDLWAGRALGHQDIAGMNEREMQKFVTKEHVFPRPNYQAIADHVNAEFGDRFDAAKQKFSDDVRVLDMGAGSALLIKKIRDSIENPPLGASREQLEDYLTGIAMVRKAIEDLQNFIVPTGSNLVKLAFGEDIVKNERYHIWNQESPNWKYLNAMGNKFARIAQVDARDWAKAIMEADKTGFPKKQEVWQREYRVFPKGDLKIGKGAKYIEGKPVDVFFVGAHEARFLANFPTMAEAEAAKAAYTPYLVIAKKSGNLVKQVDTEAEGINFARDTYKAQHPTAKREDKTPELRHIVREGQDYRGGRDIGDNEFKDAFGFRGVQFGNWTDQRDRQQSLNHAYDALMDLADALGVPPQALSLNGELGMAFGARGKGGFAAAHYEPTRVVINLTKTSGAGTAAHEWAHALDDYFGRISGDLKGKKSPFASHGLSAKTAMRPEMVQAFKDVMGAINYRLQTNEEVLKAAQADIEKSAKYIASWLKRMRTELKDAERDGSGFDALASAVQDAAGDARDERQVLFEYVREKNGKLPSAEVRTGLDNNLDWRRRYYQRLNKAMSGEAQPGKLTSSYSALSTAKGPYWARAHELFARAFESFMLDKLAGQGRRSDYLVHPAKQDREATDPDYPYPAGAERTNINAAFERFVGAIAHKETEKGAALYSRATATTQTATPAFHAWFGDSVVTDNGKPMSEGGKPLVVYRGTGADFSVFDKTKIGRPGFGRGFHFAEQPEIANFYAEQWNRGERTGAPENVMPVYLSIKNPFTGDYYDRMEHLGITNNAEMTKALQEMGHDGIRYVHDAADGKKRYGWVAFKPEQIKSAIGNTGTFDPANPDIRYSYLGERGAKVPQHALAAAREFAEQGVPMEEIRKTTGWFRAKDNKWRWEISDKSARLKLDWDAYDQTVGDALDHKALFENYPSLAKIGLVFRFDLPDDVTGGYAPADNAIHLNANLSPAGAKSTLLHELQHAVQVIEGFARGGKPTDKGFISAAAAMGIDTTDKSSMVSAYRRLLGEVEARDVQARRDLTAEELRERPPYVEQGIPEAEFIVQFKGGEASSMATGQSAAGLRANLSRRLGARAIAGLERAGFSIIEREDQLPDEVRPPTGEAVRGVYWKGRSYLVASNIPPGTELGVLLHEVGVHHGLEGLLGTKLHRALLGNIKAILSPLERAIAQGKSEAELNAIRQRIAKQSPLAKALVEARGRVPNDTKAAHVVDEVLAYTVEDNANRNLTLVRRVLAAIRAYLLRNGFSLKNIQPADLVALARASVFAVSREATVQRVVGAGKKMAPAYAAESPTFYSEMAKFIDAKGPGKNTAAQWKVLLDGWAKAGKFKGDELVWSGLPEYLDLQQGPVTKDQVLGFIKSDGVRVEETTLGGEKRTGEIREVNNELLPSEDEDGNEVYDPETSETQVTYEDDDGHQYEITGSDWSGHWYVRELDKAFESRYDAVSALSDWIEKQSEAVGVEGPTKFAEYQLPGAEEGNYRELLLRLPEKAQKPRPIDTSKWVVATLRSNEFTGQRDISIRDENERTIAQRSGYRGTDAEAIADAAEGQRKSNQVIDEERANFQSSHFDQPNILAHVRFNERTDAEGKRVLFIEEIQSDWAQKGKREGFRAAGDDYYLRTPDGDIGRDFASREEGEQYLRDHPGAGTVDSAHREGVPSAPFVGKTEAWVALALKRMIRHAAENGFEKLSWTTGEQQAERYDLSKQVEKIHYAKTKDGRFDVTVYLKNGGTAFDRAQVWTKDQVADNVGKEIADKMEAGDGIVDHPEMFPSVRTLSGLDLKVGGAGMHAFYDKIIPNTANALLKKLGGSRVTRVSISAAPTKFETPRHVVEKDGQFLVTNNNGDQIGSPYDTEAQAQAVVDAAKAIEQPGFSLTPALRDSAMRGLPLFSRQGKIARGQAAMDRVIRNRGDEMEAMERGGLGKIAFLWGNAGRLDARKGRYVEGGGVAHIIAQRDLEGKDGEAAARAMPDVIALGDVGPVYGPPGGERVNVHYQGKTAVLSLYHFGQERTWLLTGWEEGPGGAEGVNPNDTYAPSPSGIRAEEGAGPESTIEPGGGPVKGPQAPLYSRATAATATLPGLLDNGNVPRVREWFAPKLDAARVKLQDRFLMLKRHQEAVAARSGPIPENADAYLAQTLYHGRADARLKDLKSAHIDPLIEAIHRSGANMDQVEDFLYALHAPSRNRVLAGRNPRFDPRSEKYGGSPGSGMTDEDSRAILSSAREAGLYDALEAISRQVQALNEATLQGRIADGLMSEEDADGWRKQWENYVPLRGVDGKAEFPRLGHGFTVKGAESKQAFGRASKAGDLLAHVVSAAEEGIVRGEKNKVGQAFLTFVEENSSPHWEVKNIQFKPRIDKETGEMTFERDPFYTTADDVFSVKRGGKQFHVKLGDPALARSLKNLGAEDSNVVVRTVGALTRALSFLSTTANPEFLISNFARDIQEAGINLAGEKGTKMAGQVMKDVPRALRGAYQAIRKGDITSEWAKYYHELERSGGLVGYFDSLTVERQAHRLEGMLKDLDPSKPRQAWIALRAVGKFIQESNQVVESGVRLSAYVNARRAGASEAQAAALSKNLTVNFNRRGELGPVLNSLYMFFNAGVQGTTRMVQALKHKRTRQIAGGIVGLGVLLEILNQSMSGAGDDEKKYYDKIPQWVKDHNLIMMLPDGEHYMMLPLPYGYNVFHAIGRNFGSMFFGASPLEASQGIAHAGLDAFNPLGGATSIAQFMSPTLTDPIIQQAENLSHFGSPIKPGQSPFGPPRPESSLYWRAVNPAAKEVAAWLNEATGGSQVRPGGVDVSPETIEHWAEFVGGGVGRTLMKTLNTGTRLATGQELPLKEIPFARRLIGEPDERADAGAYREAVNEVVRARNEIRYFQQAGDAARAAEVRRDYGAELRLYGFAQATDNRISALRRRSRLMESRGLKTDAIEEQIDSLKMGFTKRYHQAVALP